MPPRPLVRWSWPALALCLPVHAAPPSNSTLLAMLRSGGYVILMRHASSPRTAPEAHDVDPANLRHERQLDAAGRAAAAAFGEALRHERIPVGRVLSSPTYRALETVRLAGLGTAVTDPELGDGGQSMSGDPSGRRGVWLQTRVAERPEPGTNTVIVTHLPNILEAFGPAAAGLDDGEALILRPDADGGAAVLARVKIDAWAHLGDTS